jgi:hypothetical protein
MSSNSRRKTGSVDHPIAGSRKTTRKKKAPSEMLEGAAGAIEKLKEMEEAEAAPAEEEAPQSISELRDLLFFGKITEKVQIGGFIFELTSLTNKQHNNLIAKLLKLGEEDRILHIKTYTLAESMQSINGVPVAEILDIPDMDPFDAKLKIISELQSTLVEKLFDEYERINRTSDGIIKGEDIRDQLKNS